MSGPDRNYESIGDAMPSLPTPPAKPDDKKSEDTKPTPPKDDE